MLIAYLVFDGPPTVRDVIAEPALLAGVFSFAVSAVWWVFRQNKNGPYPHWLRVLFGCGIGLLAFSLVAFLFLPK
jgi:hypothetical protein